MNIEQAAYGIVVVIKEDEYKFLILMQDKEFINWSFPKGGVEEGETPMETAMRELEEETGITSIEILDCPMIDEVYHYESDGKNVSRVNKYFVGIVKSKDVKIQEGEIYEYKWATYEEAKNTFVFKKETRTMVLEQAQKYLENMIK